MVDEAKKTGNLQSISLTSGVEESPQLEANVWLKSFATSELWRAHWRLHQPLSRRKSNLKDAGADEVKYNLETVDRELFERICPGISFPEIMDALEEAVAVFGPNRVFSNVILGLGESDETCARALIC